MGRNMFVGPGYWNLDLGITKKFDLTERVKLQFRMEMFNALNHPNFDIPSHVLQCTVGQSEQDCATSNSNFYGGQNFARVLSANGYGNKPPRQIQLSARYIF